MNRRNPPNATAFPPSTRSAVAAQLLFTLLLTALMMSNAGCGSVNKRSATEQLLMSDAVDRAISGIDFSPLGDEKIYLDTTYIVPVDVSGGFVNSYYVISSIRQQLLAAGCLLQETRETADIIVEARVGTLGSDGNEVIYGIPQSNILASASTILPTGPIIPTIPEIAVAKSDSQTGAAKVGLFAYERESKTPIWQSGVRTARSNSRDTWVLGAGPFQRGSIHKTTKFAGRPLFKSKSFAAADDPILAEYKTEHLFHQPGENRVASTQGVNPEPDVSANSPPESQPESQVETQPESQPNLQPASEPVEFDVIE